MLVYPGITVPERIRAPYVPERPDDRRLFLQAIPVRPNPAKKKQRVSMSPRIACTGYCSRMAGMIWWTGLRDPS